MTRTVLGIALLSVSLSSRAQDPVSPNPDSRASTRPVASFGDWQRLAGPEPAAGNPSVMVEARGSLYVFADAHVHRFDPPTSSWTLRVGTLPEPAKLGLAACHEPRADAVFLFPGGSRTFLRLDLDSGRLDPLPDAPRATGRGAFLAAWDGKIYAVTGGRTLDFFVYDPPTGAWETLPSIGSGTPMRLVRLGHTSGFLVADGGFVYAWPDHHVQRYDIQRRTWHQTTWTAMGFRPNCDGAGFAWNATAREVLVTQGMGSHTLGAFAPAAPRFHYMKPRLPEPAFGEGSRAAIASFDGAQHLFVYQPSPGNALWRIALSALRRIDPESRASDVGSAWETFHEGGGSSVVRRPGPAAVEGVMGLAGDAFYFIRLTGTRRYDPVLDSWSPYPGAPFGDKRSVRSGVCADYDGKSSIYVVTGGDAWFGRQELGSGSVTPLSPAPGSVGRGARLQWTGKAAYVLRGGSSRDFWRYDAGSGSWSVLPPLPDEAAAPGDTASGLVYDGLALFAFPDRTVWRFDLTEQRWTRFAEMAFPASWDGGMVALDSSRRRAYVVRGSITRELGRLDLESGAFTSLAPHLPDVASVEGNRLLVANLPTGSGRAADGGPSVEYLYIHRGHDTHEMWRIPTRALQPRH